MIYPSWDIFFSHARPECHASVHRSQKKAKPFPLHKVRLLRIAAPLKSAVTDNHAYHSATSIKAPAFSLTHLGGGDGLAGARTALPRVQADLLACDNSIGLLDDLLGLGEDQLNVAGVGHVRVDLGQICQQASLMHLQGSVIGFKFRFKRTRPWAR